MNKKSFNIDLSKLINNCLSLDEYFLVNCIYYNQKEVFEKYALKCKSIDIQLFNGLFKKKYLFEIEGKSSYVFDDLKLTEKALRDFGFISTSDYDKYFDELRTVYPSVIKINGKVIRRLHQDIADCKKKYKSIIESKEHHDLIIKCVKLYIDEHKKAGKEEFIQMLSSFLNQRNFEMYMDEAKKNNLETIRDDENYDVI